MSSHAAALLTAEVPVLDGLEDELAPPAVITGYDLVMSIQALIDREIPARHPSIGGLT